MRLFISLVLALGLAGAGRAQDYSQLAPWKKLSGRGRVTAVAFSPDGTMLAAGQRDAVALWGDKGEVLHTLQVKDEGVDPKPAAADGDGQPKEPGPLHRQVDRIVFSPDGKIVAAAASGTGVRLWAVATGALLHALPADGARTRCLAFSPDGMVLATGGDDLTPKLWSVATGKALRSCLGGAEGHLHRIIAVDFSEDGSQIVTVGCEQMGANNGEVRAWRVADGKLLDSQTVTQLDSRSALLVGAGHWLISYRLTTAGGEYAPGFGVWDTSTGALTDHWNVRDRMFFLAVSKDLSHLAGGCVFPRDMLVTPFTHKPDMPDVGHLNIWNTKNHEPIKDQPGPSSWLTAPLCSVAFSSDGRALAIGTEAGSVEIWAAP